MADVLLDTTFFIDLRRGDPAATQVWRQIERGELSAAYSSVTAYELWLSKRFERPDEMFFRGLFAFLEEEPLTAEAAAQAAVWLRRLPRKTRDRRLRDAFIAASAQARDEKVYTRNVADMRRYYANVTRY